jgi:hypothetical protein
MWDPQDLITVVSAKDGRVHINVGWPRGLRGRAADLHFLASTMTQLRPKSRAAGQALGLPEVELWISHTFRTRCTLPRGVYVMRFDS